MIATLESPNELAQQLTGRDYVSFSALSTFRQCPLRYYFKYVAGLPEPVVSSGLVFGGAVHSAIEQHYRALLAGETAPGRDMLLEAFWSAWHSRSQETDVQFARDADPALMGSLAERVLTAFCDSELAHPAGAVIAVEEELREALVPGCPDLLARIDLAVETHTELVVTDFKTSRSRWSGDQAEQSGEQLVLYGELAQRLAPAKDLRLEFGVVTKAKTPAVERYQVTSDPQRVERTKRVIERVWQAILSGSFYPAPSPLSCSSCPYRDPCRDWNG